MITSPNENAKVSLGEHGFMFAVSDVDPAIGTVKAHIRSSLEDDRIPIELVNCKELMPGGMHEGKSNNENFDLGRTLSLNPESDLLCPIDIGGLDLQGEYGADVFIYAKIYVEGCKLETEKCKSDAELSETVFNLYTLKQLPNVMGREPDKGILYSQDNSNYYYFDPEHR